VLSNSFQFTDIHLNPAANGLIAYRNQLSPIMTGEHIDEFSDHRACRRGFQHSLYADSVKWVPAQQGHKSDFHIEASPLTKPGNRQSKIASREIIG
jgi:hypothetical protein